MEYATCIWNPYYDIYSEIVERVQRKFTRYLIMKYGLLQSNAPYVERLRKLNFLSLEDRRLYLDEIMLFKIINAFVHSSIISRICFYVPAYHVRQHSLFYTNPFSNNTNIVHIRPISRMQFNHNEYFSTLNLFDMSTTKFKGQVKNFLSNK